MCAGLLCHTNLHFYALCRIGSFVNTNSKSHDPTNTIKSIVLYINECIWIVPSNIYNVGIMEPHGFTTIKTNRHQREPPDR